MIVLDQPSKKMEVVLAGAVATSQLDVNCYFFDQYPQAQAQPRNGHNYVATNNTTDVTAVAAPAIVGIRRNVFSLSVYNKDSAQATVTVKIDDGGSERILVKQTLNAGDSLNYEHGAGWTFTTPVSVPFTDTLNLVKGSADGTKQLRIEVDGLTANTTRVWNAPDADLIVVGTTTAQTLTNKTLTSPTLDGTPVAPTASVGTSTTQVATTAFVLANTALVLLGSKTLSASATATFVHTGGTGDVVFDWTAYDEYEFHFVRVVPVTTNTLFQAQIGTGATPTYQSGAASYSSYLTIGNNTAVYIDATSSTLMNLIGAGGTDVQDNGTDYGLNGVLRVTKPSQAIKKSVRGFLDFHNANGQVRADGTHIYTGSTDAWTGIKFFQNSGNLSSGVIHAYGVKKS